MHLYNVVITLFFSAMISISQALPISGTVKDRDGNAIAGATVTLEQAAILTTTAADGSFKLSGTVGTMWSEKRGIPSSIEKIDFIGNTINFHCKEKISLGIAVYTLSGRHLLTIKKMYQPGIHCISLPLQNDGMHLVRIITGKENRIFKLIFSGGRTGLTASGNSSIVSRHFSATRSAVSGDFLLVVKDGYLNYRMTVSSTDTSGIVITILPNAGNLIDIDGNVYQTVQIGNQVWMAENLRTTRYNDQAPINQDNSFGNCYFYDNNSDSGFQKKWGALYTWDVVNSGKLAPAGWRVPSDADWDTLQNYLIAKGYNWDGTTTDNMIAKSIAAQTEWAEGTFAGEIGIDLEKNNTSGFSALPGGYYFYQGFFLSRGDIGSWWSSTAYNGAFAWGRQLRFDTSDLFRGYFSITYGYSVRLMQDILLQ